MICGSLGTDIETGKLYWWSIDGETRSEFLAEIEEIRADWITIKWIKGPKSADSQEDCIRSKWIKDFLGGFIPAKTEEVVLLRIIGEI